MKKLDETAITVLYERYSPKPSAAFYERSFPWKGKNGMKTYQPTRLFASTISVVLVLTLAVLFIPPLRTLAQDAIDLLVHYNSDTRADQPLNLAPPGADAPIPLAGPNAIAEAEAQAGFDIPEPTFMPSILSLSRVTAMGNMLLEYVDTNGNVVVTISALPAEQPFQSSVGASAPIETITVGDVSAQYTEGLWMGQEGQPDMTWFQTPVVKTITWWKNGLQVDVTVTNSHTTLVQEVTKDELIEIALSMIEQQ